MSSSSPVERLAGRQPAETGGDSDVPDRTEPPAVLLRVAPEPAEEVNEGAGEEGEGEFRPRLAADRVRGVNESAGEEGEGESQPPIEDETADDALTILMTEAMSHPLAQDLMLKPTRWRVWPAVAVIRWLQRKLRRERRRLIYRSEPSLGFAASEVRDLALHSEYIELTLSTPGLAAAGSPLPPSDIFRIISDRRDGGALSFWLDGISDGFMHVLEAMQSQSNAAFALLTGGQIEAHTVVADMVGRSAPLRAEPGGALYDTRWRVPEGAIGLVALFLGPISASGLAGLFSAFTTLPVRITEFAGAEVTTRHPARVGRPFGMILGAKCRLPSAGVEVHIEGGSKPNEREWARDPVRRRSLHRLASSYIGAPSPVVRVYLWLDAGNVPPAALAGDTAFGGLAVLGGSDRRVKLPIVA